MVDLQNNNKSSKEIAMVLFELLKYQKISINWFEKLSLNIFLHVLYRMILTVVHTEPGAFKMVEIISILHCEYFTPLPF